MPYVIELTRAAGRRRALARSDQVRLLVAVRRAAREAEGLDQDGVAPAAQDVSSAAGARHDGRRVT